jgi:hypothetical protein
VPANTATTAATIEDVIRPLLANDRTVPLLRRSGTAQAPAQTDDSSSLSTTSAIVRRQSEEGIQSVHVEDVHCVLRMEINPQGRTRPFIRTIMTATVSIAGLKPAKPVGEFPC